ncbi:MAG: Coenzyme F420 hydrogenase/dehydrogenase, beta subunit C-terminal domain [Paludibacteraceae bacterium]|nr:Coenzyme F420 hydrogenase/dehydrogenase, beta subunit C-terminal domain [Paludibacteraceae bacterium]
MISKAKEDCCGCSACVAICPKGAISMKPDTLGFLYPYVDSNLCVNCGLCDKVCSFHKDYDTSEIFKKPFAYAARHKSLQQIETSRSGAAFVALSDWILEHNGVVYGVGHKGHFVVAHKRATTKKERDEFKGSKYVQSDIQGIYSQVKSDLQSGKVVLFSGTPCQTAGLNSFIGEKLRKGLYLVDIVCHGVPGAKVWSDYLAYLERKEKDTIIGVNYRNKLKFGWNTHRESFLFKKGEVTYNTRFYNPILFRLSCNKCPFCNTKRPSDITIADFWGWQKVCPEFNLDNKGLNLVLVNSEKGKMLFEEIKDEMNTVSLTIEQALQPNLISPSIIHPKRLLFEHDYQSMGFEKTFRKYALIGWRYQILYYYSQLKHRVRMMIH